MVRKGYNKYGAKKVSIQGITFHSRREGFRYLELLSQQQQGHISELELQPKYTCIVNDKKVCDYIADFKYMDRDSGEIIIEDVKSPITAKNSTYRLKKKLVEALHAVVITEVK